MWDPADIAFVLDSDATEAPVVTLIARTPAGDLHIMAELVAIGRKVEARGAHTFGPAARVFGGRGRRAIARAFMEQFDVEEPVVAGAPRTTGANPGRTPRPFVYRRRAGELRSAPGRAGSAAKP